MWSADSSIKSRLSERPDKVGRAHYINDEVAGSNPAQYSIPFTIKGYRRMKVVKEISTDLTDSKILVINRLKKLLESAEKGEIEGIVFAVSESNKDVRWDRAGMQSIYAVAGCLQSAALSIMMVGLEDE